MMLYLYSSTKKDAGILRISGKLLISRKYCEKKCGHFDNEALVSGRNPVFILMMT